MEFFCTVCNNDHDYKTLKSLNQHKNSASHKRKVDPEFAAAEEAEKAAKKRQRRTKENLTLSDGRVRGIERNCYGPFTRHEFMFVRNWNALSLASRVG
jgi:hypothetical protein